jgi:hypothetical protein
LIVFSHSKKLLYHAELLRDEILIANLMHFLSILFDIFKYHILVQVNNLERLLHNRRWGILLPETVPAQRAIRLFFQFEPKPNFSQSKKYHPARQFEQKLWLHSSTSWIFLSQHIQQVLSHPISTNPSSFSISTTWLSSAAVIISDFSESSF